MAVAEPPHPTKLYRAMRQDVAGRPQVGAARDQLGVRPGVDIRVRFGNVEPGVKGMSVTPDDPARLPQFLRPARFGGGGFGSLPVFVLDMSRLGAQLAYCPDPSPQKAPGHGSVVPAQPTTLAAYQSAIAATHPDWAVVS